jgi:hypothetical protein
MTALVFISALLLGTCLVLCRRIERLEDDVRTLRARGTNDRTA